MQDPYPATFQRRHHNVTPVPPFYTRNNNLSKNFTIKSISNQSLDVITETGWYSGNNIKELDSYKLSWCMIHAMVQSDNAATIYVSGDNGQQLIVVKRNTDGTYAFTPYATKSDLSDRAKKLSANFTPGNTVLDVSSWSVITLLSIVTYKEESTALYLLRKESSSKIYCIPVKSSTQVSVTYNGENKLILTNSATYGGTYTVLFLS